MEESIKDAYGPIDICFLFKLPYLAMAFVRDTSELMRRLGKL